MIQFEQWAIAQTTDARTMTALEQNDKEDAITAWLDGRSVEAGRKHAPALVEAGVGGSG